MEEKRNDSHRIAKVMRHSPAAKAGIRAGDLLLSINGQRLLDIFDYHYFSDEDRLMIEVDRDGERRSFFVEKEIGEEPGLVFENGLLDDYRSCSNACVFCFIDQMPPGMRDTLYFKDDDTRLSFLQGNYVTLTNMKDDDLDRIISYRLAPINISVHTTNPELRCKMLHNRFAGDILSKIKKIADAGLPMNAQIVLCRGLNDGEELSRTVRDLLTFYPHLSSLSVVPVGLTKFREGLYPLESFDKDSAAGVLDRLNGLRQECFDAEGEHFVHASDEWYLLAGRDLPPEEEYDGYPQLENGVGMLRLLIDEFYGALETKKRPFFLRKKNISIATGLLAAPTLSQIAKDFMLRFPERRVKVFPIINEFFGEKITVSGLITGRDLIAQLKDKKVGHKLLIPENMLRAGEEVFLDDVTVSEVRDALQVPVDIVKSNGVHLLEQLLK